MKNIVATIVYISYLTECARLFSRKLLRTESVFRYIRFGIWRARLQELGIGSTIEPFVVIQNPKNVKIGNNVSINHFCHIWGGGGVIIGDNCLIASHVTITTQTHSPIGIYRESHVCKPICIGENVWIGSGSIILPGITIGDSSIIGAGSVVTRDVPPRVVVTGVPAEILRSIET